MKNNFLRFTSSDSIRSQIQREEINRIIQDQAKRKEEKKKNEISQISLGQNPRKEVENKRQSSSFSIRKTKSKQLPRCSEKLPERLNLSVNLDEQIHYFSVKKRYEKVIDTSFDHQLIDELRHELATPRYNLRESKTCNFFQKVFAKDSKLKRYF
jgi:hypothetical protein